MSSNGEHIDDFFRRKQEDLLPGTAGKAKDWEEMTAMLDGQPSPPRVRKKITRRIITYLGVAAVVTTVTYYSVTRKREYTQKRTVTQPVTVKPPQSIAAKPEPVITKSPAKPANTSNAPVAVSPRRQVSKAPGNLVLTKIKEVSDTAWQVQPLKYPPPSTSASVTVTSVNDFYRQQQQPEQVFDITAGRDTLLFGNDGTVLKIPAFAFLDQNWKPVKGQVQLKLTECYHYADMLAHRLTTTSDGEPLVTGGMVKIDAAQEGKPLQVQQYQPISVAMPMERYDPAMQLFLPGQSSLQVREQAPIVVKKDSLYILNPDLKNELLRITSAVNENTGDTLAVLTAVGVNWKPAGQRQALTIYKDYVAAKSITLFELRQRVKGINDSDEAWFTVKAGNGISDEKIRQLIALRYNAAGYKRIHIERVNSFAEEVKGKETRVLISKGGFVAGDSVTMNFGQALKEKLVSTTDSIRFTQKLRMDSIEFFEKWKRDSIAYVRRLEFNKAYSFDVSKLGWINCDRFMNKDQPRLEFTIRIEPGLHNGNSDYKLIFTNMKSVLPGHYANGLINFGSVPVGEPVQVVCVSENGGKTIACVQKAVTGREAMANLAFEPITPAAFREKILQLR